MAMDKEVSAMNRITKMMSELSEKDRAFVVRWFVDKYGAQPGGITFGPSSATVDAPVKR